MGETSCRLYCQGPATALPVPGTFLLCDEKGGEVLSIHSIDQDTAFLSQPPTRSHARGCELIPVLPFTSDNEGRVSLRIRTAGELFLCCQNIWQRLDCQAGNCEHTWKGEGFAWQTPS